MTGDLVKAMRALPAADRRGGRRRLRRRRRDAGARLRHPPRHAARADRVPVHARRTRRRATWAPARCCRASIGQGRAAELLYTGRAMDADEGARVGLLQRACVDPSALLAEAQALRAHARRRPDLRARDDQDACCTRNGRWALDEAIEAEAQAQAICMQTEDFRRAYRGVRRQGDADVRGQLMRRDAPAAIDTGRSSTTPHRALAARDSTRSRRRRLAAGRARPTRDVDARLPRAGCAALGDAGFLRHCVPAAHGGASAALDSRVALRRPRGARLRTTDSPTSRSRCRGSAPARSRSPAATAQRARWLPRGRARRGDRGVRALRAGRRLRRRGA